MSLPEYWKFIHRRVMITGQLPRYNNLVKFAVICWIVLSFCFLLRVYDFTSLTGRKYNNIRTWNDCPDLPENRTCGPHGTYTAQDVQVIVKTGGSEPKIRLQSQLSTVLSGIPPQELLIFSDLEEDVDGYHVKDILATLPEEYRKRYSEFGLYNTLKTYNEEGKDPVELKGGWELDKYKNLPIKRRIWEMKRAGRILEEKKWFVFLDTDTFVYWPNLYAWLSSFDPSSPLYFGSAILSGHLFAHGGTGYILSQGALEILNQDEDDPNALLYSQYGMDTHSQCCGDVALAAVLQRKGIFVNGTFPMFNGEGGPDMVSYGSDWWCEPVVTFHHIVGDKIEALWEWVEEWKARTRNMPPLLFRDLFENLIAPQFNQTSRQHWSNIQKDYGVQYQAEIEQPSSIKTFEECEAACKADSLCLTYQTKGEKCTHAHRFRLGGPLEPEGNSNYTSGWMLERIKKFAKQNRCEKVNWVPLPMPIP